MRTCLLVRSLFSQTRRTYHVRPRCFSPRNRNVRKFLKYSVVKSVASPTLCSPSSSHFLSLSLSLSSALIFLFVSFIFRAHSKLSRYAESRINWYARATFFSLSRRERSGRSDTSICNMLPMSYSRDFSRDSILYFLYLHARSYTSCISREIIFLRWTRVWKKEKLRISTRN